MNDKEMELVSDNVPYLFFTKKDKPNYDFLLLSKNGEKRNKISSILDDFVEIYRTPDKGFWGATSKKIVKFDSVANQSVSVELQSIKPNSKNPYNLHLIDILDVTSDNGIVLYYENVNGEAFFSKLSINGKVKIVPKKINNFPSDFHLKFQLIDENKFVYSSSSYYQKLFVGVGNFNDINYGWSKEVDANHQVVNFKNNIINISEVELFKDSSKWVIQKFKNHFFYDLNGEKLWEFSSDSITYSKFTDEYTYLGSDGTLSKIQSKNGKLIWKHKVDFSSIEILNDNEGNDYLVSTIRRDGFSTYVSSQIEFVSKLTNKISRFYNFPKSQGSNRSRLYFDSKKRIFFSLILDERESFILRKYSTHCLYDLEAQAEAIGRTEVCSGTKVKLSTTKQDGLTYQWQKDGKDIPTFKDIVYDVEESGNYAVKVKDENCQSQTTSNPIKVTVKPLPEASISTDIKGVIYEPFTVKMSANSGTGLSYQWLKDDVAIPNETGNTYEAKKSGKYNLSVTKEGCVKISDALTISILIPLANSEEIGEEVVQIYPNPNKGNFNIILPKSLKSADIQLFDSFGRERLLTLTGEQAQAEGLMTGVYFLKVNKDGRGVVNKILVE